LPGEMDRLEPMIRPTIGVFTNIGEAHSEGFSSLAEKAAEKLKLFVGAETLIYCSDQPATRRAVSAWIGGGAASGEAAGANDRAERGEAAARGETAACGERGDTVARGEAA